MQAGAQAAAGTFLGASVLAAILAMLLPVETMGIALPEDAADMQANENKRDGTKGEAESAMGATLAADTTAKDGDSLRSVNPFAADGKLTANSRAAEYQDQYGLDGVPEQ